MIETTQTALGARRKLVSAVPDESVPDWVVFTSEKAARAAAGKPARKKRHTMTAEGKARIAAAQNKRWAALRKANAETKTGPAKTESKPIAKKPGKRGS